MASYLFRNVLAVTGRTTADPSAARQDDNVKGQFGKRAQSPQARKLGDKFPSELWISTARSATTYVKTVPLRIQCIFLIALRKNLSGTLQANSRHFLHLSQQRKGEHHHESVRKNDFQKVRSDRTSHRIMGKSCLGNDAKTQNHELSLYL